MNLSQSEIRQYQRQMILKGFGKNAQLKLKQSKVLCVGAGGLGSPVLLYIAAAGVGTIGIVDPDCVDTTNLHRQVIHSTHSVDRLKTNSAKERMHQINPHITINEYAEALSKDNVLSLFNDYDLIIDGTDNFQTRYLINDAAIFTGKPVVFASIHEFVGQVTIFADKEGPCYRCIFPTPPDPNSINPCSVTGVLGVLPGVVGSIQATECIKYLTGTGKTLVGRLLTYDSLAMRFSEFKLKKNISCAVCSESPSQTEFIDYDQFCGINTHKTSDIFNLTLMQIKEKMHFPETILVDIRDDEVIEHSILEQAKRIPFQRIFQQSDTLFSSENTYVFLCNSGKQSEKVIHFLKNKGFQNVFHLENGLENI